MYSINECLPCPLWMSVLLLQQELGTYCSLILPPPVSPLVIKAGRTPSCHRGNWETKQFALWRMLFLKWESCRISLNFVTLGWMVFPLQIVVHSKNWILDLGDNLRCFNVQTNYLLASKWKVNFNLIFHITPNSCQLIVQLLDIDISIWFKVSFLQHTRWIEVFNFSSYTQTNSLSWQSRARFLKKIELFLNAQIFQCVQC